MEPAYVDNLETKDVCQSGFKYKDNELGATLFTRSFSTCRLNPSSDNLDDVGETLKATASLYLPPCSLSDQPANAECYEISKANHNRRPKRRAALLIATQLNELQSDNPDKLLVVKKINRLGFGSAEILKTHFEKFGPVEKVRLSNAHTKEPGASQRVRLRPSGIAFVLFKSTEAAAQVLAEGDTQLIHGLKVYVRGFERRRMDDGSPMMDEVAETDSTGTPSTRTCSSNSFDQDDVEGEECQD
jgi:hypothetical protein